MTIKPTPLQIQISAQIFFLHLQLIFLLWLNAKIFSPCVRKCPENTKNQKLIKSAKKQHMKKRKWHAISFVLCPTLLRLVSMDAELNSVLGNGTYFCPIFGCGTQKSSQTWKSGLKLKKLPFDTERLNTGKWCDLTLCILWTPRVVAPAVVKIWIFKKCITWYSDIYED